MKENFSDSPILEIRELKKYFPIHGGIFLRPRGWVYAVDDVSLSVKPGETLGLVGESGCGKTTLGRCIMGLYPLTHGKILLWGQDISKLRGKYLKTLCLKMQMIFQDPFESLNARHTIGEILKEKYIIHNRVNGNTDIQIKQILETVGLSENAMTRFPHEFSGGQRQRIGIARAISLEPELIICDEPVSALDVSIQSQILNLMLTLQREMGLTYVFISHDLAVVKHMSDRIAVMYLGKIVEIADAQAIYQSPYHPYTRALLSAIPLPEPGALKKRIILKGEVPSPSAPPAGCRFHTRCPHVESICSKEEPILKPVDTSGNNKNHLTACHLYG